MSGRYVGSFSRNLGLVMGDSVTMETIHYQYTELVGLLSTTAIVSSASRVTLVG